MDVKVYPVTRSFFMQLAHDHYAHFAELIVNLEKKAQTGVSSQNCRHGYREAEHFGDTVAGWIYEMSNPHLYFHKLLEAHFRWAQYFSIEKHGLVGWSHLLFGTFPCQSGRPWYISRPANRLFLGSYKPTNLIAHVQALIFSLGTT